jgi:hypothetical protein
MDVAARLALPEDSNTMTGLQHRHHRPDGRDARRQHRADDPHKTVTLDAWHMSPS